MFQRHISNPLQTIFMAHVLDYDSAAIILDDMMLIEMDLIDNAPSDVSLQSVTIIILHTS